MSSFIHVNTQDIHTIPMDTTAYGVLWSSAAIKEGGRFPGSFQVTWSGADATDGNISWEVSNDSLNWATWTGSLSTDNTAVTSVDIETAAGTQMWEVEFWTFNYYRLNYKAGANTTGTLTYRIYRTK
jgi:hypothetical protein